MNKIEEKLIEQSCIKTYAKYAIGADSNINDFVSCFTPDATWVRPGMVMNGRSEIRAYMEKQKVDNLKDSGNGHFTCHLFTTVKVDVVDDSEAKATAYGMVYRERKFSGELPCKMAEPELVVRYDSRFKCVDGEWLLHHHQATHLFRVS